MDDAYILEKLLNWAKHFYGERNGRFAFSKKVDEYYLFGFKKKTDKKVNRVSKAVAIYLCVGLTPKVTERIKAGLEGNKEKPTFPEPVKTPVKETPTGRKRLTIPRVTKQPKVKRFRITEG